MKKAEFSDLLPRIPSINSTQTSWEFSVIFGMAKRSIPICPTCSIIPMWDSRVIPMMQATSALTRSILSLLNIRAKAWETSAFRLYRSFTPTAAMHSTCAIRVIS